MTRSSQPAGLQPVVSRRPQEDANIQEAACCCLRPTRDPGALDPRVHARPLARRA